MNLTKRIIPLFMVFATLISSLSIPCYAADGDDGGGSLINVDVGLDVGNFWEWVGMLGTERQNQIKNIFDKDVCPRCPNSSGRHSFVTQHTTVDGQTGNFYVCEYCGKSAGEVGADAYNNYVQELPFGGIDSEGGFLWYPTVDDIIYSYVLLFNYIDDGTVLPSGIASSNGRSLTFSYSGKGSIYGSMVKHEFKYIAPLTGAYYIYARSSGTYRYLDSVGSWINGNYVADCFSSGKYEQGAEIFEFKNSAILLSVGQTAQSYLVVQLPVFRVVPLSAPSGDTYNIDYRPTSIYAPVSYTDNSGQTKITGDIKLFSENEMTLTNPQTNTITPVTDWSYDYSTRTYDLTLDSGDHSTVTYGDENITVKMGDNTYVYNYYMAPTGEPSNPDNPSNPDDPSETANDDDHRHDWVLNADSTIWHDADGNEIPPQFLEYTCSKCHLICRCYDGETPPVYGCGGGGSGGELVDPGGSGLIPTGDTETGLALIRDKLLALWTSLSESFGQLPQFYAAAVPMIPPEILQLMEWAVVVGLLVGVWRLLRR